MIGGGAFTAFADQLIEKLPEGTIGILGEGEDAILKVIEGQSIEDERYIIKEGKQIKKGQQGSPALLDALTVDLPYLTSIFPQYREYIGESIGVQSKRGCPYDCAFCLYPYIEGKRVRYRPAAMVVQGHFPALPSMGGPSVLVHRCPVHYRERSLSPMHGDPGTDSQREAGDRMVRLYPDLADYA